MSGLGLFGGIYWLNRLRRLMIQMILETIRPSHSPSHWTEESGLRRAVIGFEKGVGLAGMQGYFV